jgi:hypothetical protein
MSETTRQTPQIGKDVIESLTLGMYEDCRFIYREYIQNSADAIDNAIRDNIITKAEGSIFVDIDPDKRRISISDNATGISQLQVMPILRNIAHSTKKRGEDKGFRGIGRLGGLGYCTRLIFETSFKGEPVKSIMTWDSELLKFIINDRTSHEQAVEVLERVTELDTQKEQTDEHYFKVILEDVTSDELLDINSVTEYLSMVAPVDLSSQFMYRNVINDFKKENNIEVDTYNIFVNGDQIYKPYTSVIYDEAIGGKKKIDDILSIKFLLAKDDNGNLIYWGWYSISCLKGQMKPINIARGIRLRKENIQIGDEEICKKFFTKTEDQRFSFYYFGEVHAISKGLIPNSRRDYFGESPECTDFERRIRQDFLKLKDLCYDAQKLRSSATTLQKGSELRAKIEEKERNGYTSQKEKDDLHHQLETQEKKEAQAKKQLANVTKKIEESESPLINVIDRLKPQSTPPVPPSKTKGGEDSSEDSSKSKIKYRTDKPEYSSFSKKEKKLIGRIYAAIGLALADESLREALLNTIERQITQ